MLLDIGASIIRRATPRFDVVYHLLALPLQAASTAEVGTPHRLRLLAGVAGGRSDLADDHGPLAEGGLAEREIFDLFGIRFAGHPNLRRVQMPEDWEGLPCVRTTRSRSGAREDPAPGVRAEEQRPGGSAAFGKAAEALQRRIVAGDRNGATRHERRARSMTISMGPQHPSTHGSCKSSWMLRGRRRRARRDGDRLSAYRHREDGGESLLDASATVIERMDYLQSARECALLHACGRKASRRCGGHPRPRAGHSRFGVPNFRESLRTAYGSGPTPSIWARFRIFGTVSTFAKRFSICSKPPAAPGCIRTTFASAGRTAIFPTGSSRNSTT